MIKSFRHKGVERFFLKVTKAGIQAGHAARLPRQLHWLKGDQEGICAVWVSENWRLTFRFEGEEAALVDYRDYH